MSNVLSSIEITGVVDRQHRLHLDEQLPLTGPKRVRVIVLYPVDTQVTTQTERLPPLNDFRQSIKIVGMVMSQVVRDLRDEERF